MAEQRIGDNYLQALLENYDEGITPSRITFGNLLRDLADARALNARLSAELGEARKLGELAAEVLRVLDARGVVDESLEELRVALTDTAEGAT